MWQAYVRFRSGSTTRADVADTEEGARSALEDAMSPENLLCYEMNGAPLPPQPCGEGCRPSATTRATLWTLLMRPGSKASVSSSCG